LRASLFVLREIREPVYNSEAMLSIRLLGTPKIIIDQRPVTIITLFALRLSASHAVPLDNWLTEKSEGHSFFLTGLVRYARENKSLFPVCISLAKWLVKKLTTRLRKVRP